MQPVLDLCLDDRLRWRHRLEPGQRPYDERELTALAGVVVLEVLDVVGIRQREDRSLGLNRLLGGL